jgi:hypothetical protein
MAEQGLYIDELYPSVDTNTSATTDWIDVSTCDKVSFYVEGKTGTHVTHKVGIQCSPDGVFNAGSHDEGGFPVFLTGEGHKFIDSNNISFIRMFVETVEGGVSTCDLYLQGLRDQ